MNYEEEIPLSWIQADDEHTQKLKVPGGWLYRSAVTSAIGDDIVSIAMVFVPAIKKNGKKR